MKIIELIMLMTFFSVFATMAITGYVVSIGVANDYVLEEIYNTTQVLIDNDIAINETAYGVEVANEIAVDSIGYADMLFMLFYVIFVIGYFIMAYNVTRMNIFEFSSLVYFGLMIFLFILEVVVQINDYLRDNILFALMPNMATQMPFYTLVMSNLGLFIFVQIAIGVVLNVINLDIMKWSRGKSGESMQQREL